MSLEIERKYLVCSDAWRADTTRCTHIEQGYLCRSADGATVRVRIADTRAYLTVKGPTHGTTRPEYEYPIPLVDARAMLALCTPPVIVKDRYIVEYQGFIWEIDSFISPRPGLILAEVELPDADTLPPLPPWVGEEVTDRPEYYNANIS